PEALAAQRRSSVERALRPHPEDGQDEDELRGWPFIGHARSRGGVGPRGSPFRGAGRQVASPRDEAGEKRGRALHPPPSFQGTFAAPGVGVLLSAQSVAALLVSLPLGKR